MVGRDSTDSDNGDGGLPSGQSLNEALKNPLVLILVGALSGGTGTSFFVDDSDRFKGKDAEALERRFDRKHEKMNTKVNRVAGTCKIHDELAAHREQAQLNHEFERRLRTLEKPGTDGGYRFNHELGANE